MASRSSPRKSSSSKRREALALLLRDGRTVPYPTAGVISAAVELKRIGLVTVLRREFVLCAEPRDRDFPYTRNRSCQGRIHLREDADEDGNDYRCPECDRVVFPQRNSKAKHLEIQVSICAEGVIHYVRGQLGRDGFAVKDVAAAVFRVDGAAADVFVCIAELCGDETYLTRDRACSQPTLYIAVDETTMHERFLPEQWVTKVCLADLLCGKVDLIGLVKQLARDGTPRSVLNVSVPVYSAGPPLVIVPHKGDPRQRQFFVEFTAKALRVNGVTILASQAKTRFRVFGVLWKRYLEDLGAGKSAEEFRTAKVKGIAQEMAKPPGRAVDEDAIRRTLNRLQGDIATAVKKITGDPIGREDIIESVRWTGQNDTDFGYRINPRTVVARPVNCIGTEAPATSAAASANRVRV